MIVIGIDPGTANTGFGVVRTSGERMVALDGGVIETPVRSGGRADAWRRLHDSLGELIRWHEPKAMALEDLFFGKNVASALSVGEASGVALLAAAKHEIPCFDYTPAGGEEGRLRLRLGRQGPGPADGREPARAARAAHPDHAADAFAVAICHAGTRRGAAAAVSQLGRPRRRARAPALVRRASARAGEGIRVKAQNQSE